MEFHIDELMPLGGLREQTAEELLELLERRLKRFVEVANLSNDLIGILLKLKESDERSKRELRSQLEEFEEEINHLRMELQTDSTSGLPNRRGLEVFVEKRKKIPESDLCVMSFLDIDYFKQINDAFGHIAGDAVLRETGRRLQAIVRDGDIVSHLHGDEFVIIFSGVTEDDIAYKFPHGRFVFVFEYNGKEIPVSLSVGSTAYVCGEPLDDAKYRADENMYFAKKKRADVSHS